MFYKLLGMAVWRGGKVLLRRQFRSSHVPKPVLAVAAVAVVGGAVLAAAAARRNGSDG